MKTNDALMARPQFAAGDFVAAGAGNFVYRLIRPATDAEAQRSFGGIAGFDANFFWLADVVFDSNVSSPSIDTPSHNGGSGRAFLERQTVIVDELHVWRFDAVALGTLWSTGLPMAGTAEAAVMQVYDAPDIVSVDIDKYDDNPKPGALVRHLVLDKRVARARHPRQPLLGTRRQAHVMQLTIVWTTLPDLMQGYEDWKSMQCTLCQRL